MESNRSVFFVIALLLFSFISTHIVFSDSGSGPSGGSTPIVTPSTPDVGIDPSLVVPDYYSRYFDSSGVCVACQRLDGAPHAYITSETNTNNKTINFIAYYENLSAIPSRVPIRNAVLIIETSNSTFSTINRIFTDSTGHASFNFSRYSTRGCYNFKVLYCPFCLGPACGFSQCLAYAGINTTVGRATDFPISPSGAIAPSPLTQGNYLPAISQSTYCAPPTASSGTPEICFPVILIFSLLAGSLYLIGRNPFTGFNMAAPKLGQHIKYQARGRGFSLNTLQAGFGIAGAISAAKTLAKKDGGKELVRQEVAAAKERSPLANFQKAAQGLKNLKMANKAAAKGKDGKALSAAQQRQTFQRTFELLSQTNSASTTTASQTSRGLEVSASGSGFRVSELSGSNALDTLGRVSLFLFTQTTLGGLVNSFYSTFTQRSLFDAAFLGPIQMAQRRNNDLQAFLAVSQAASTIDLGNGVTARLTSYNHTQDGGLTLNLTLNNGQLIAVNYNQQGQFVDIRMNVGIRTQDGQNSSQTIIVTPAVYGSPVIYPPGSSNALPSANYYVQNQTTDSNGRITTQNIPIAPVQGDQYYLPLSQALRSVTPVIIPNTGNILAQFNSGQQAFIQARTTLLNDISMERHLVAERFMSAASNSPTFRADLERAANSVVTSDLAAILHVPLSDTRSISAALATRSPSEVAILLARSYETSFGRVESAVYSAASPTPLQTYSSSDMTSEIQQKVMQALRGFIGQSNLSQLSALTPDAIRSGFSSYLVQAVPGLNEGQIRTIAEAASSSIPTAATAFREACGHNFPPILIEATQNTSLSLITRVVDTGYSLYPEVRNTANNTDNIFALLLRADPSSLSVETRSQLQPGLALNAVSTTVGMLTQDSNSLDLDRNQRLAQTVARQDEVYNLTLRVNGGESVLGTHYLGASESAGYLVRSINTQSQSGLSVLDQTAVDNQTQKMEAFHTSLRENVRSAIEGGNFEEARQAVRSASDQALMLGDDIYATTALNALAAIDHAESDYQSRVSQAQAQNRENRSPEDNNSTAPSRNPPSYQEGSQYEVNVPRDAYVREVDGLLAQLRPDEIARRSVANDLMHDAEAGRIESISQTLLQESVGAMLGQGTSHTNSLNQLESWYSHHHDLARATGQDTEQLDRTYTQARDAILRARDQSAATEVGGILRDYDIRVVRNTDSSGQVTSEQNYSASSNSSYNSILRDAVHGYENLSNMNDQFELRGRNRGQALGRDRSREESQ